MLCTKDTFLAFLWHFFSFVILLFVLDAFFLGFEVPVDDVETQSANYKYRWFSIVQYLFSFILNNKTTEVSGGSRPWAKGWVGSRVDLLALLAFLPSAIYSFLPKIMGGARRARAPPLDLPLKSNQPVWQWN